MRKCRFCATSRDTLLCGSSRSPNDSACVMHALTHAGVASGSMPGYESFGEAVVDAVDAERAFGCDRAARIVMALRLVRHRAVVGERGARGLVARLIRAGHGAIRAADAEIVVDRDDAVGALFRRRRRADVHARRVVAVLAADGDEGALDVGVLALFDVEHAAPLHAGWRRVRMAARGRARLAAHAAAEIGDHRPPRHWTPTLVALMMGIVPRMRR